MAEWLIQSPGCRRDLERLSHCRQREVGFLDGAAGLEGRFRKFESCDESLFVHLVMMIARGLAGCRVEGQREWMLLLW